jgi:hypothetical protein
MKVLRIAVNRAFAVLPGESVRATFLDRGYSGTISSINNHASAAHDKKPAGHLSDGQSAIAYPERD